MCSFRTGFFRSVFVLEAGAAILFFGLLLQHPEIERHGATALQELVQRGYVLPTDSDPVRVYPSNTEGPFSSSHAGGWRPGAISLRVNPEGALGPEVFLRHELMHEASFRTCGGKLPIWAEEAAAMSFSGELSSQPAAEDLSDGELAHLRRRVRIGAPLDKGSYKTLSKLLASHGWPQKPCAISKEIEEIVIVPRALAETGFSYVLVSIPSGSVLESKGDLETRFPPGSLLKIPYAAALGGAPAEAIGEELAASDTENLLRRRTNLDWDRFRFLLSPVKEPCRFQDVSPAELSGEDERFFRSCLGERSEEGDFALEANLRELARILRASLLYRPDHFRGLSSNGFAEHSTLYLEPDTDKRVLKELHAMSKTGTVSDERGNPLIGHLMVAWPAEDPLFLALFRSFGTRGASVLHRASGIIEHWSSLHPIGLGKVRVRLLSLVPRSAWEVVDECPAFDREEPEGWKGRVSTCGRFRIHSSAKGSRSERLVLGVLKHSPEGESVVLETDPETYADAVLSSEAEDLRGEARKALRAVVAWNGAHGTMRHEESSSLCDTTHCMVFQGSLPEKGQASNERTDPILLAWLDRVAQKRGLSWLPFSKGGDETWERVISVADLKRLVDEPSILDVRRERTRKGEVSLHLMYAEDEEIVSCEVLRNRLKLPSCPEAVHYRESKGGWIFSGIGEGHGEGLSVSRARALGQSGHSASAILADAYAEKNQ